MVLSKAAQKGTSSARKKVVRSRARAHYSDQRKVLQPHTAHTDAPSVRNSTFVFESHTHTHARAI